MIFPVVSFKMVFKLTYTSYLELSKLVSLEMQFHKISCKGFQSILKSIHYMYRAYDISHYVQKWYSAFIIVQLRRVVAILFFYCIIFWEGKGGEVWFSMLISKLLTISCDLW